MHHSFRSVLASVAILLAGIAGIASANRAEAAGVQAQAHIHAAHYDQQRPYPRYRSPRHYRADHGYYYRPSYRHYYNYHHYPRYRWRDHRTRDFLNCRWVPGEGRVCW